MLLWIFLLGFFKVYESTEDNGRCENSQKDPIENILPCDYKNFKVPTWNGHAVKVEIGLQIYDIYDLNDETMDFYIHLIVNENWTDQRLKLNVSFLGHRPILLPKEVANKLWQPDIFFENSKYGRLFDVAIPNISYKLLPLTGQIYKSARYLLKISCAMDLHFYPMDTQTCTVKIALFATPDDQAELTWVQKSPMDLKTDIVLPQFSIAQTSLSKVIDPWETGNYTTLLASFTFNRYIMASLVNIYIPSILVVFLSWLSFWLDVDTVPARITLGVTSLLTVATQVVQSRSSLPPIAYISALDVWLFVSVNMVFLTLVEYAVAYYYTYYFMKSESPSVWVKIRDRLSPKKKVRNFTSPEQKQVLKTLSSGKDTPPLDRSTEIIPPICKADINLKIKNISNLDHICRYLFPAVYCIFNIVYWSYCLSN